MRPLYIRLMIMLSLAFFCAGLSGCGETFQGVKKDATRMGRGVRTIFIRDGN